jgi:hypothetical protein
MVCHLMSDQFVLDVEDFVTLVAFQFTIFVVNEDVLFQPEKQSK